MIIPTVDFLDITKNKVPDNLISDTYFFKIREILKILPHFNQIGFECPIHIENPKSDLCLTLNNNPISAKILSGNHDSIKVNKRLQNHQIWNNIQSFLNEFFDSSSSIHKNIRNLFFEFDIEANKPDQVPVPKIFFDLIKNNESKKVIDETTKHLFKEPLSEQLINNIQKCLKFLSPAEKTFHIGFIPSGKNDFVRLCFNGLTSKTVNDYFYIETVHFKVQNSF